MRAIWLEEMSLGDNHRGQTRARVFGGEGMVHRQLRSIGFVLISVAVATLMTFPFRQVTVHNRGLFFIAAVMLIAKYEGTAGGIASALLSAVVFDWFFDQRPHHLDFDLATMIRALAFCSFAFLVASLEKQRQRAIQSLQETNQTLQHTLDEVKTLRGLLPICAYCKQIKAEDGSWFRMEQYIREHTYANFTHGICPECYKKHYPEIYEKQYPAS
jgi:K+-sensing histidine kinase KdpD